MSTAEYTCELPAARDRVRLWSEAPKRSSFWERLLSLVLKGSPGRKHACLALMSFPVSFELPRGKVVWVCREEGVLLECNAGVVWITEGGERDLVLTCGESLAVHRHQRALVHALRDAQLTLRPPNRP